MDIIVACISIELVRKHFKRLREDCDKVFTEDVWAKSCEISEIAETNVKPPKICG